VFTQIYKIIRYLGVVYYSMSYGALAPGKSQKKNSPPIKILGLHVRFFAEIFFSVARCWRWASGSAPSSLCWL